MELHRGLRVLAVEVSGLEVRADVYGGAGSVCGTVLYRMTTEAGARRRANVLRRWVRRGTPVTYVRNGESASLVDEQAFMASRIGSGSST